MSGIVRPLRGLSVVGCVIGLVLAVTAPGAATADPPAAVTAAWQWVLGQRGTGTQVTSASTITPDALYPASWTGAVSGEFTPDGVSSPVVDPASIVVDAPTTVPGDYAGVVDGHVTVTPQAGRWIVQVYRDTASGRVQVPLQALVAADGTFRVDLSAVTNLPAGTWALGLLDATNGYAPTGTPWPAAPVFQNWVVRAYVVTDTAYLIDTQPARADGTFAFDSSATGTKVFQLVDTGNGAVLAEAAPDYGLVRSYAGGTRSYAYDQALTVLTAIVLDAPDTGALTDGLLALQAPDGGFFDSADVRNPAAGTAIERAGVAAIATYALLRRLAELGPSDPDTSAVQAGVTAGLNWLVAQLRPDGLVGAGTGDYDASGAVDPSSDPTWVSTEHNLDTWQTFHLAAQVLGGPWSGRAASLATAVYGTLWDDPNGRFRQGLDPTGAPDATDTLDVAAWGSLFLRGIGRPGKALTAVNHAAAFASTVGTASGYRAYYPQSAFPSAPANVWIEGGAGVALAQARAGRANPAAATLAAVAARQRPDGSFPYALVSDAATSMTTTSSVAATDWYVLAALDGGGGGIWS